MPDRFLLTPFRLDGFSAELELLVQPGWQINRPALPEEDSRRRLSVLHQPIADFVANTIARGDRPVSIAGDCCAAIGVVAGLQRAGLRPAAIWLDAHGDFNTWETTPSGFLGGMPLAMLVGRGEQTLLTALGVRPLPEAQVILTDARDLDPAEEQAVAGSGLHHLADCDAVLDDPLIKNPLYVHFDTDIVNPNEAPAMGYRAPGGPPAEKLRGLFRSLGETGRIVAASMTTWDPRLDHDGRSQAVCMELLGSLLHS